jgi:phage virion morphogenesis protein
MRVSADIDDRAVMDALQALLDRGRDLSPALSEIGETLVSEIKLGFRSSSDPWGAPWQPLSEVTVARRRGNSSVPLRDTGQLMNSIQYQVGNNSVAVGPADHAGKARMHQFGGVSRGMFRGATIPARPYMPIRSGRAELPPAWGEQVLSILRRHMEGGS